MNEDIAWEYFSKIPIGTVVSWIIFVVIIISVISAIVIKLYKIFDKSKTIKEENDEFKILVKKHDETLELIQKELKSIRDEQKESKKRELKRLRHSIVRAGEEAVSDKKITIRKLKSLEELYQDYTSFDENGKPANGYVKSLMVKVRDLEVVGNLDENNEDIE